MRMLYYSPGTIALAPHILLSELGEPFEIVRVAVADNAHKNYRTPEFLEVTPRGFVPALVDGPLTMTESLAIALHLAEKAPERRWLPPSGSDERAQTYEWLAWLVTSVLRSIGGVYRPEHIVDREEMYPAVREFAERKLLGFFGEIERAIPRDSTYFRGGDLGIIDPFLLVFYRWGLEIGVDMSGFQRWRALTTIMLERPAVREALEAEGIEIRGFPVPTAGFGAPLQQARLME